MDKKKMNEGAALDKATAGKSISLIDILVALFGILGFACLGVGVIHKGIKGDRSPILIVGITLSLFAVLWIVGLILIKANRKKRNPGLLWHLCILLLDVSILFYLLYGRAESRFEVSTFNLIVCIISVAFALISLFLYFLRSPKIGVQYFSFILMLFAATFAVINFYSLHLIPYLTVYRGLEKDASTSDRIFSLLLVIGAILLMVHTILLVAALAGGLVDRGSKIGLYAEELPKEDAGVEEETSELEPRRKVLIKKSKKEGDQ